MSLETRSLAVRYAAKEVLRSVSVGLERGEITAICGPNGAGKSTLLDTLAGLMEPTTGDVCLEGLELKKIRPKERARRIGYLAQNGQVAWDVSVRGLVALGRIPHGDRGEGPVELALATMDLQDLSTRPVSHLSGGELARALLARVLAGEPEWILADEPLAALDLGHQLSLLRHLRAATTRGVGVAIVLHDLNLAMNHADRIILLDKGELAGVGKPQEVLTPTAIERIWRVQAQWSGEAGRRALIVG